MSAFLLPKPEQLADLTGTVAAVQLAMSGAFDDKIAELKKQQAALGEKLVIAGTLDEAQQIKDDANAYAASTRKAADDLAAKAQAKADEADSRLTLVTARESAVRGREVAANARQQDQDARDQAIANRQDSIAAVQSARDAVLAKNEADYAGRNKKLTADIAAFNQRLEALKV